ncbi:MAG: hypothetical protein IAI49_09405, partial [Candidatus Eremiobacteraeota bacterium]|nr:hypothetical protein [Candidatus Eremiobacteraeota bacterium]
AGVPETRLIDREAGATFAHAVDAYVASLGAHSATYRSPGVPSDTGARVERFASAARANDYSLETIEDVRTGDVVARVSHAATSPFVERLADFETERRETLPGARVLAAPQNVRALLDGWVDLPPALDKMRALKNRFDPRGTLSPGRFVGGI